MKKRAAAHNRLKLLQLLLVGVALLLIAGLLSPATAATFTVTSTVDAVDASPGNGICLTAGGVCTLRAAITEANAAPGSTIILPAGTYTLTIPPNVLFADNNANGDLDILTSMTIIGAGAAVTTINGNNLDRVLDIYGAGPVSISGLTIRGGNAGQGAGISTESLLSLTDVVVTANQGSSGGGIWSSNTGQLLLTRVVVSNNSGSNGGGMYINLGTVKMIDSTISGNTSGNAGGGIYLKAGSTAQISGSTISGNSASGNGGGIFNQGALNATNCTISGNSAINGGGIYFQFSGTLMNVTIFNNSASISGGGIGISGAGFATLTNTIVAGSVSGGNCGGIAPTSNGYNLDDANTCGFSAVGDQKNKSARLDPLANNGGFTQTHALQSNSSAIDAGTTVGAPATDQRGVPRIGLYDVGAYEGGVASRQPDLMIKLTSEADTAYAADNIYEAVATNLQSKGQSALSGTTVSYSVKLQNDGNPPDSYTITGTAGNASFAVQYLDEGNVDRTAAVTGAGYTLPGNLTSGASVVWTLKVTPAIGVAGGTSYPVFITATSAADATKKDQVAAQTYTPLFTPATKMTLNNVAAVYTLTVRNLGFAMDNIILNGTGGSAGFTVQYLDPGNVDRTAAVIGAGYVINNLPAGGSENWAVKVTPVLDLPGNSSYPILVTLTSQSNGSQMSQAQATTSTPALTIIKQVWLPNGTSPLAAPVAAVGSPLDFLIYVKNTTAISVSDVRINDILDENAFDYVSGTLRQTNALADSATDLQIFTAAGIGALQSDVVDGDVASAVDTGGLPAVDRITVGAVAGQANGVLTIAPNSTFALRYRVRIK